MTTRHQIKRRPSSTTLRLLCSNVLEGLRLIWCRVVMFRDIGSRDFSAPVIWLQCPKTMQNCEFRSSKLFSCRSAVKKQFVAKRHWHVVGQFSNAVPKVFCCQNWVEFTTRLHHRVGFSIILQKPAVCSLIHPGVHIPLPQYPAKVSQLLSRYTHTRLVIAIPELNSLSRDLGLRNS